MRIEAFVGLRHLRAKRREVLVSMITLISLLGVTIGVMTLDIVLSVMSGFETDLRQKILGFNPHIVVVSYGGALHDYRGTLAKIRSTPDVVAAAPFVYGQAMLSARRSVAGVVVRGIDPAEETVVDLERHLVKGKLAALAKRHELELDAKAGGGKVKLGGIIVGKELARQMGLFMGDPVRVLSPLGGTPSPAGMIPRMRRFVVVGIFDSGMFDYDTGLVYVSLADAQSFLDLGDGVSGIEVKVADVYRARTVARRLEAALGGFPYRARDWTEINRNLFSALKLEKTVYFIVLSLIVVVAAFNIFATLTMVVKEKRKDIAILKSMGSTNGLIQRIFVLEGMAIGLAGTLLGTLGGFAGCLLLQRYHFVELPKDVFLVTTLPVRMEGVDFLAVALVSVAICLVASLSPAWRAANLDPVEVIRYE